MKEFGKEKIRHKEPTNTAEASATECSPVRIQRKRMKGWKMPANTVYVGRPTKWGNPFVVGKPGGAFTALVKDQRHAWQLYRSMAFDIPRLVDAARTELKGKNLACFCPLPTQLYEPDCCHAAILLEIANAETDADAPDDTGLVSGKDK